MNNLNIIDSFMASFITYLDSGFGLLGGEVHFLSTTLIGIDVTLAALFWAMGDEDNIIGKFLRKILFIGAFAYIISNFSSLATIIYKSFVQAGITAGGGGLSADDLLKPGKLAGTGFSAAWPLLDQVGKLMGFTSIFDNFLTVAVLLFAWVIVILAFFILAVQMFVCVLEFKLTTLAGFILVPFALWNRTNFLAERVLGNVVSSGVKVMVLAVIVGIGSNFFAQFTTALQGQDTDIGAAMSLVLASLAFFGLGIFGPGIASGLVSGAPQLGAGAAVGTVVGAAGVAAVGGGAALVAVRAGTTIGAAVATSYRMGQQAAGSTSKGAGLAGVAHAASNAARAAQRKGFDPFGFAKAAEQGKQAGQAAFHGGGEDQAGAEAESPAASGESADGMPAWARSMHRQQNTRHQRQIAIQALKEGDGGGSGATPDIDEKEE